MGNDSMDVARAELAEMIAEGKQFKKLFGREVTMADAPNWYATPAERYAWAAGFHDGVLNFAAQKKSSKA
jgi:hypothetical protein